MSKSKFLSIIIIVFLSFNSIALADGMYEEPVAKPKKAKVVAKPAAIEPAPVIEKKLAPKPVAQVEEDCEGCTFNSRVSFGVPVAFFNQEEKNLPLAGMAVDFWCNELPLNVRVGVEGRHMYLSQDSAQYGREWEDKTTRVTYLRIPFSFEYKHDLSKTSSFYIGAGPDIIHTANDITETAVGMHVSARLYQEVYKSFGVSLEAGYMWGSLDGEDGDIKLDNAYVTPMLSYTF
jgi:hypothetical protein